MTHTRLLHTLKQSKDVHDELHPERGEEGQSDSLEPGLHTRDILGPGQGGLPPQGPPTQAA